MRVILTLSTLLLLISGNVQAGSGYDRCINEQNALEKKETSNCSGFRYLLNPSACFATQKALKEYTSTDKCKKIGSAENVDSSAPPNVPAKKAGSDGKVVDVNPVAVKKSEPEAPQQEGTCKQLKDENSRLKAEIQRLWTENEQFRKRGH